MNPILFAVVDAVLAAHVLHRESMALDWRPAERLLGWWRSTWSGNF